MTLRALVTARPSRSGRQRKEGWLEAPHHKTPATAPRRFPRGPDESATPPGSTSFPRRSQAAVLPAPTPPHAWSGLRTGAAPPPRRPERHPGTPGRNKGGGGGPSPFRAGGRRLQPHPGPRRAGEDGVEFARRERPRTRDRAAESARSRARARGPQGAPEGPHGGPKAARASVAQTGSGKGGAAAACSREGPRGHRKRTRLGPAAPTPTPDPYSFSSGYPSRGATAPGLGGREKNPGGARGPGVEAERRAECTAPKRPGRQRGKGWIAI